MNSLIQWIQQLHFVRPWWLLCLILVPIAYILRKRFRRGTSGWETVVSAELLEVLMPKQVTSKQYRIVDIVVATAFALAFLALSGPSWEKLPQPVDRKNDNLVLVWDLSYSMYVADISPSRFVRAKQKITDILRNREEGTTGMIAYAGDAHIVTPLTNDTGTIQHLVSSLNPSMMPIPGSNTTDALMLANQLVQKGTSGQGRILLVTDDIQEQSELSKVDIGNTSVHILGVGTKDGGPIPVGGEFEFLRDENGNLIRPTLDGAKLRKFAQSTGGSYNEVTLDDSDIADFFDDAWQGSLDMTRVENREFDVWHDAGYLLLVPIALLAVLGLRRGIVVVALLVVAPNVKADWKDDIWVPRDRQGFEALTEGRADEAESLFKDSNWQAVAKYRGGKFEEAAEMFQQNESISSKYNLGNALARNGQLEDAIAAYEDVLEVDPTHQDAEYNKKVLEELLDQLKQQVEQQQQGSTEQESDGTQEQSEQDSDQSPEQSQQQQSGENQGEESNEEDASSSNQTEPQEEQQEDQSLADESQESDSEEGSEEENSSEEQAQSNNERESEDAFDRWLRRIPDDPGSLLSNKFRHESIQRVRRGEIKYDPADPSW